MNNSLSKLQEFEPKLLSNQNLKTLIKVSLLAIVLNFSTSIYSQNPPEFIQEWQPLEEAEFHYDVSYAVVKCSPTSNAQVILNAFDESGSHSKIGFTLDLTDATGNKAQVTIPLFSTKLGDMNISSCESELNSNLKFEVPAGIDAATMKIEITYNTGS
ncbi:hypothetical protein [Flavicella sediminum]|uniref:hypothetical protein n=1 Tax=Flavicella sediminum TaxID=2585141 RepID=UPI00111D1802|nr:hypothetical protein [Flavicella sediminum]